MELIYVNGQIDDVRIGFAKLQARLTKPEKLAMFGISAPDATLWTDMVDLEEGKQTDPATAVNRMVTIGAISSQRATELLA